MVALSAVGCAAPALSTAPETESTATAPGTGIAVDTATALQSALDDTRSNGGFPGVAARVITPDGTWTGTSGASAPGGDTAPAPDDHTRIGSLTKTMTATILLQLVGESLVSLDDPISQYVPDSPNGTATLRQLADMTSGIPSYSLDPQWAAAYFGDPSVVFTPQQLLDYAKQLPLAGEPGEVWQYSNTNYILLGMVIEQVLSQPLGDVFEDRLFGPLGMDDTVYPAGSAAILEPHLVGITAQGQPAGTTTDATDWNPSFGNAAGEVISTLDDLTLWAHAMFSGEGVLTPELQQVRRDSILSSPPPNDDESGYGLGWGQRADGYWGHSGTIPGFTTSVFHSYDDETTIVVMVNSDVPLASGEVPAPAVFEALAAAIG
ncbi:serine hydrolase domain-containing protein [Microbacterium sp. CPCC 204701]|uniref:serine hydrolase domain-containing protein n=1 Tax=Microbacterium sp. CPCC 204701 TaxID=2493084 RepID=UPI00197C16A3|nr:serine hydrolase domain-containing protein [Microbacterium sp. CPCC 204701]